MKYLLATLITIMAFGILAVATPGIALAGTAKVDVCHIPPGNPENFHTIRISANAVDTHLAHGDLAGACNDVCKQLCDDGDACTIDDTGDCQEVGCPVDRGPTDCNDNLNCTTDACNSASGCVNEPVVCDDPDLCTSSSCSEADNGACVDLETSCDAGEACNLDTGLCEAPPCVDILTDCNAGSAVIGTFCGLGSHNLTLDQNSRISYVILKGSTDSVVLNHQVDTSVLSGANYEIFNDTNLCNLPGGASGDPRWNDEVSSIEIK